MRANYMVERRTADELWIRDVGPWEQFSTITNDAEAVVNHLFDLGELRIGQRLFYFDSEGNLDEIVIENKRFLRFAPVKV